ncbi:MAG: hypothetical protein ABT940_03490 [Alphaproteobacteria bacterium]
MGTVGDVSFDDGRSVTMDLENVTVIERGTPMEIGEGQWFCELIVRTETGFVALQMLSDSPEKFEIMGAP